MKKALSLAVAVIMISTLSVGCGQISGGRDNAKTVKNTTASTGEDKKLITFKMFSAEVNSNADNFESPVAQKILEKTGVTLDIEYAVGDPKEKLSIMAASGDYPDIVYAKGDLNILKNAGAIIKLDDLIDKFGSNIKKLYGDYLKRLRWSKDEPYLYCLGSGPVGNENLTPTNGFELQHAVVRELGYPKIRTLQDFENAIKQYMEKYPTIDGQPTIGLSLLADDWRFLITVTNPACFATGGPDDGEFYIDINTNKATLHHVRPDERKYFRWLNHMNTIGLLDQESFVQKYDQYKAKIASGRVLALADAFWDYTDPQTALRKAGKEDRMYGMYPITLNENIKYHEFQDAGYSGGWGVAITTKCKDPERAIKFFDWMSSEEAQVLTHWGIEGVHYTYENGKRVLLPQIAEQMRTDPLFKKKTGVGNYAYPFPEYGNIMNDSTRNCYQTNTVEKIISDYTAVEKEVLAAYGVKMWKELYPQKSEFPVKPWGYAFLINMSDPEIMAIGTKCQEIGKKRIPEAILAKPEKFDEVWDKYMKELDDAGRIKYEDALNKLIQERLEMWK